MDFNEILKNVTVRIYVQGAAVGTGIILKTGGNTIILTAKHCLSTSKGRRTIAQREIVIDKIRLAKKNSTYRLKEEDLIILNPKSDLAAIQIKDKDFPAADKIPSILVAEVGADGTAFVFKGFPRMLKGKKRHSASGTLNRKDTNRKKFRLTVPSEFFDRFEKPELANCIPGFSGSGVCTDISGRPYLQGIITKWGKAKGFEALAIAPFIKANFPDLKIYDIELEEHLPDSLMLEELIKTSNSLKPRYTKDNLPLPIETAFDQLALNERYLDDLSQKLNTHHNDLEEWIRDSSGHIRTFIAKYGLRLYNKAEGKGMFRKSIRDISFRIGRLGGTIHYLVSNPKQKENWDTVKVHVFELERILQPISAALQKSVRNYEDEWKKMSIPVNNALRSLAKIYDFLNGQHLLGRNWLLINGEAGSGKSQLLAFVANRMMNNNLPAILVLGQGLKNEEIWGQISGRFCKKLSVDRFLELLEKKAKRENHPAFVFIDAINEGQGLKIWNNHLQSFLDKLNNFPNLRVVLSCRTSYQNALFRENQPDPAGIVEHRGFTNMEKEAVTFFFENASLPVPNIPKFSKEFANPLFLTLFVKLYKEKPNLNVNTWYGITYVFRHFFDYINEHLGHPDRYNYDSHKLHLVDISIRRFVKKLLRKSYHYISYAKAYKIVEQAVSVYTEKKGFLKELVDEGVFYENIYPLGMDRYQIGLDFSYQKLGEHIKVSFLLNKIGRQGLAASFNQGGLLFGYFSDQEAIERNRGLLEALFIQIAARYNEELFSIHSALLEHQAAIDAFLSTLRDRPRKSFNETTKSFLEAILARNSQLRLFWDNVLEYVLEPGNGLNVDFVHDYLLNLQMAERDVVWTHYLQEVSLESEQFNPVKTLINWSFSFKKDVPASSSDLPNIATILFWLFTASNRRVRDEATKASIWLFKDNLEQLVGIMKKFEKVDDPYVQQRIYAVAFGAAVRTKENAGIELLADYIFNFIFNRTAVFPDILLRDYARLTIEFASKKGLFNGEISKIRPPYRSQDFASELANLEQADYGRELGYTEHEFAGIHRILSSMITEHSSKSHMYGDFGRYVFGYAFKFWPELNDEVLSDFAVKLIVEKFGYNKKLSELDSAINESGRRRKLSAERIGKKYQWISLFHLLAVASDNYEFRGYYGESSDGIRYDGPWIPKVRDIDPTAFQMVKNLTDSVNKWWFPDNYEFQKTSNDKWLMDHSDMPNPENLVEVSDADGEKWLALQMYHTWREKNEEQPKELWYQLRSYLTKRTDHSKIIKWAKKQNFMGRWMPEATTRTELYLREFFWSPAMDHFRTPYHNGESWQFLHDPDSGKRIGDVSVTTLEYLWDEQLDTSQIDTTSLLLPNEFLFELLELEHGETDGTFINKEGVIIAFDPNGFTGDSSILLLKKDVLLETLDKNNLDIFWTILGEKLISSSGRPNRTNNGRAEISFVLTYHNDTMDVSKSVVMI